MQKNFLIWNAIEEINKKNTTKSDALFLVIDIAAKGFTSADDIV